MPRPGFYNDNEYRVYPFIRKEILRFETVNDFPADGSFVKNYLANDTSIKYRWAGSGYVALTELETSLPNSAVVDCGVIMGLDSEFDASQHIVWLARVSRVDGVFEFELRTDAPGAQSLPIVFTRDVTADEWQSEYGESAPYVKDVNSCAIEPSWSGFLVTGPLTALNELLPANGTITLSRNFVLEPGRIQSLVKSYLRSITVANMERPLAHSSCEQVNDIARSVIINSRCVAGNIRFKEGYNAIVQQRDATNEISIGAGVGSGAQMTGELCEHGSELPFYTGEEPPAGSQFFSGGPSCDELVSSINGVQGPDVTIAGGTGVAVKVDTENPNTIKISLSDVTIAGNC